MIVPQEIYHPLYEDKEKFIILITGGRGSGKSFNASTFIERLTFEMTPVEKIVHQILVIRHTDTRFLRDDGKLSPPTGSWEESVLFLHRRRVNTILSPADMHPILFLLLSAWQLPLLRTEIPTVMS